MSRSLSSKRSPGKNRLASRAYLQPKSQQHAACVQVRQVLLWALLARKHVSHLPSQQPQRSGQANQVRPGVHINIPERKHPGAARTLPRCVRRPPQARRARPGRQACPAYMRSCSWLQLRPVQASAAERTAGAPRVLTSEKAAPAQNEAAMLRQQPLSATRSTCMQASAAGHSPAPALHVFHPTSELLEPAAQASVYARHNRKVAAQDHRPTHKAGRLRRGGRVHVLA